MPIKNFGFLIFLFMTEIGAQISTCKQLDTCTWPRVGIPLFCCCGNLLLKCPSPKKKNDACQCECDSATCTSPKTPNAQDNCRCTCPDCPPKKTLVSQTTCECACRDKTLQLPCPSGTAYDDTTCTCKCTGEKPFWCILFLTFCSDCRCRFVCPATQIANEN